MTINARESRNLSSAKRAQTIKKKIDRPVNTSANLVKAETMYPPVSYLKLSVLRELGCQIQLQQSHRIQISTDFILRRFAEDNLTHQIPSRRPSSQEHHITRLNFAKHASL